jgi:hypothetical protein
VDRTVKVSPQDITYSNMGKCKQDTPVFQEQATPVTRPIRKAAEKTTAAKATVPKPKVTRAQAAPIAPATPARVALEDPATPAMAPATPATPRSPTPSKSDSLNAKVDFLVDNMIDMQDRLRAVEEDRKGDATPAAAAAPATAASPTASPARSSKAPPIPLSPPPIAPKEKEHLNQRLRHVRLVSQVQSSREDSEQEIGRASCRERV